MSWIDVIENATVGGDFSDGAEAVVCRVKVGCRTATTRTSEPAQIPLLPFPSYCVGGVLDCP